MDEKNRRVQSRPAYIKREDDSTINETSTIARSAITFTNNPRRYVLSHDGEDRDPYEDEDFVVITEYDQDHTKADKLTFFGFASMRGRLHHRALEFLLKHRRWANDDDSECTVGKKNLIILFIGLATIEDCLVCEDDERLLPTVASFTALMDTLGILQRRGPQAHTFVKAIQRAFTRSRLQEIQECLQKGQESPTVPEHPLDKMLLDVVDRHITFLHTKKPLTRLAVKFPLEKTLRLRCSLLKSLLATEPGINKCWTQFVPTIPAAHQATWPWPWKVTTWEAEQAKLVRNSGSAQLSQGSETLRQTIIPSSTRPSLHTSIQSDSRTSQLSGQLAPLEPPQDTMLDMQTAFGIVEASFDAILEHIRPGNVLSFDLGELEGRLEGRHEHFLARMDRVITKRCNRPIPSVQDRGPLDSERMITALSNLDRGLLSIMARADRGELSVEECEDTRNGIKEDFELAYSNLIGFVLSPSAGSLTRRSVSQAPRRSHPYPQRPKARNQSDRRVSLPVWAPSNGQGPIRKHRR